MNPLPAPPGVAPAAAVAPPAPGLPPLRQELRIEPVPAEPGHGARWRLVDPLRERYFLIDEADRQLLAHWHLGRPEAVQAALARRGERFSPRRLDSLLAFLRRNHLVQVRPGQDSRQLLQQARSARPSGLGGLFTHFLGWRLPLWRPQGFLEASLPAVRWLWSWPVLLLWALATVTGLYLVSRQWDSFVGTFAGFLTPQGLLAYGLTLLGLKLVHELGHAYAAVSHGAPVASMGLSFAFGVPMPYTDTSTAARLDRRAARLWVDGGGVLAESLLAGLATLGWAVLPDGTARSLCFLVATSSWLTTLAVNLNPLARFDGYYFLADALRITNLQPRALAHAGWVLGRLVLGPVEPRPEALGHRRAAAFLLFGTAVWCYRVALVLGACALLYAWVSPLLALVLGSASLWALVAVPAGRRLAQWWALRGRVPLLRLLGMAMVLGLGVACLVLPLDRHVSAPAMLAWQQQAVLQAPEVAVVDELLVRDGQAVRAGQVLARLSSPELSRQQAVASANRVLTEERLDRIAADVQDRSDAQVLLRLQGEAQAELAGLAERARRLVVVAPVDGRLVDLLPGLQPGRWVRPDQVLGRLLQGQTQDVRAYVPAADLGRVQVGAAGRFVPDDLSLPALAVQVAAVDASSSEFIQPEALASTQGGPLAVQADAQGRLQPLQPVHALRLTVQPTNSPADPLPRQLRGQLQIDAEPVSVGLQAGHRLWRLLVAELSR